MDTYSETLLNLKDNYFRSIFTTKYITNKENVFEGSA